MPELIISREFLLASYYSARDTMGHDEAVAHVAQATGQAVEPVAGVVEEEATA